MLEKKIFSISSPESFESVAIEVFQYQYKHVKLYRQFCDLLQIKPDLIQNSTQIPCLPIQFFKEQQILSSEKKPEKIFTSSGTTSQVTSKHYVASTLLYEKSFLGTFKQFYGSPEQWVILALLPSYLERKGSSLVYMADVLIKKSNHVDSGFYLNDLEGLAKKIKRLEAQGQKTLLIGVSYALLDLIERETFHLQHTVVMETGGMKGRRKELVKQELHQVLSNGFGVSQIHSEYGMTELLSQSYATEDGRFYCPPWMKILTRDTEDPLTLVFNKTGGINVIDLANIYSCAFIATQDLGRCNTDGSFEILGRFDISDIRGCNLMVL